MLIKPLENRSTRVWLRRGPGFESSLDKKDLVKQKVSRIKHCRAAFELKMTALAECIILFLGSYNDLSDRFAFCF